MKYTAGPWEIRKRDIEGFYSGYVILNEEENDSNSNIIAAAPEMLEALEAILEICTGGPCKTIKDEYGYPTTYVSTDDIKSIVKEVITKAKGEKNV